MRWHKRCEYASGIGGVGLPHIPDHRSVAGSPAQMRELQSDMVRTAASIVQSNKMGPICEKPGPNHTSKGGLVARPKSNLATWRCASVLVNRHHFLVEQQLLHDCSHIADVGRQEEGRLRQHPERKLRPILLIGLSWAMNEAASLTTLATSRQDVHVGPRARFSLESQFHLGRNGLAGGFPAVMVVGEHAPGVAISANFPKKKNVAGNALKKHSAVRCDGREGIGKCLVVLGSFCPLFLHVPAPVELNVVEVPACEQITILLVISLTPWSGMAFTMRVTRGISSRRVEPEFETLVVQVSGQVLHSRRELHRIGYKDARAIVPTFYPTIVEDDMVPPQLQHSTRSENDCGFSHLLLRTVIITTTTLGAPSGPPSWWCQARTVVKPRCTSQGRH
mmetsp:Transcript_7556/g.17297  ORF Transcript_7556/g.17297 Transcript_7556/m.17297 type:complete len:392 (+) Transcript_7556:71-1246(+)